jgi:hypothetical protein
MHQIAQRLSICCAAVTLGAGARAAAQEQFANLTRAFDYSRAAALDVHLQDSTVVGQVVVRDISYASPRGGRVPAYLVVPTGGTAPAWIATTFWRSIFGWLATTD